MDIQRYMRKITACNLASVKAASPPSTSTVTRHSSHMLRPFALDNRGTSQEGTSGFSRSSWYSAHSQTSR